MSATYRSILLFGCPGSGKGTQGEVLGKMLGFVHLSMGDVFRALDKESEIGREFMSYASQGKLVPDELTLRVWRQHVEGLVASGAYKVAGNLLLLDGIPRTREQAELMAATIDVARILVLDIENRDALVQRLKARATKQGRADDADERVIRTRFETYDRETLATLGFYDSALISKVNADQSPIEVTRDIIEVLIKDLPECTRLAF